MPQKKLQFIFSCKYEVFSFFSPRDTRELAGYLVHIYDKSQLDNLTKDQIIELLKKAGLI
ncbi:hypothetical protein [Marinoscillum furvescens]|uniref:Uncharacterized protein n=1 Tax=Marinoscillum furvescens DSM 4134 TaxID=1122208 RepID=A0A3D9L627_MARFU|nr:hypothetical protein [Marinoscillum furvescens]REE00186.1 hypothetical protein C7460_106125 [Marinoscillum furvescens DSM 4134]